jgi:predicted deacylase
VPPKDLEIFLPELVEMERLHDRIRRFGKIKREAQVAHRGHELPIYSYAFGPEEGDVPTLILVGGVHGLERIGTRVVTSYLVTFLELMEWDELFQKAASRVRVLFYPLVNPGGMWMTSRANPNGVDLMRNAPVEMDAPSPWRLFQGHRLSGRLPWYRGKTDTLEPEAQALCDFIEREIARASFALTVDVHSGFGAVDRLWFPYAKTKSPFGRLPEAFELKRLLDRTYPNHVYRVEPQSRQYTTHGDLWDYLFDRHAAAHPSSVFLPFSLEMGSWIWVKKNPRQLFSLLGAFNPVLPHRKQRTLRRHVMFFDFLVRATLGFSKWALIPASEREDVYQKAVGHWYGR